MKVAFQAFSLEFGACWALLRGWSEGSTSAASWEGFETIKSNLWVGD